ncbi:MAG: XRE family transcriptional regulator [Gemmatales bacterium]|nr:XRE family transcriptional regulator [Gemmatales bacterium]MDW8386708.1 XRE family transcriptional regulator [Gemmatales bacterium]
MPQPDTLNPRILGQRIAEARKARGMKQEEVAEFLGCSRPTYIAIEKGERLAKSDEIIRLAAFFGKQVNEIVRPTEPVVDFQPHLRAVAAKMKVPDEAALQAAIADFRELAENYRDLERMMNAPLRFNYPPEVSLDSRIDAAQLAESVAIQERRRLGLGDQPVIYLRRELEWNVGLRIFYSEKLPSPVAGMYAYSAELGCCILINRKHPPERRRVSMLHEYGHLIVDRYKPGIDYLTISRRKPANERFAESFALSFLMPASSVCQRFHDIVTTTGDFKVRDLRLLSHFYFVSVEAMTLRLEQLGLISPGSWRFLREERFSPRQAADLLKLPPHPIHDDPYPERYKFLAVHAYERGDIGDSDLARYLRCDIATAREIADRVLTSTGEMSDAGQVRQVRLDFNRSLLRKSP